jgi:hypothetical protein
MSCFSIEDTFEDPPQGMLRTPRLIATVKITPDRPVFAAAAALSAQMAGCDLVIARPNGYLTDPARSVRALLDAAQVSLAADVGCAGPQSALQLVQAGAERVVISTEAVLHPRLVPEVIDVIGEDASLFLVDCQASSPCRVEVIDPSGRSMNVDCNEWLDQLQKLGAKQVILRPRRSMPSELLLPLIDNCDLTVHIERPGWSFALVDALGAHGLVTEGALGCREQLEWREQEVAMRQWAGRES